MTAHSAARCQCNSRIPPAASRMLTPETSLETGKSLPVTWRAQPFWMRRLALLQEDQNCGRSPTPVAGGLAASRELRRQCRVLWTRIRLALWIGIDRALWRLVGI